YVKVVDELGLVLVGASVWSVCDGASLFVGKQGADGFDVVFSGCSVAQLRASALGYKDKTVGWNKVDQSVTIKMDKDVQVASVSFVTENITVANRVEPNVDVSIKDSLGGLRKILTDSSGTGLISLPVGDYNYSAVAFGEVVTGSFKVESTKSMEVKITFTKNRDPVSLAKNKIINIAVFSDANSPIMSALVNVYMDGNIFSLGNTTNSSGLITRPIPVNEDYLTNKFFVVISASGYEKKIVKINPIDINSQPTKIELKRGENKLIVKVIDDQNTNVRSATVRVINTEFNLEVNESENKTTDNNGVYVLKNLPTGNYKILVGTNIVSGETTARMDSNKETYVEVQLTLNMGFIRYNFVDEEGNKINPLIKVYKILENGTNDLLFTGHPKNGVYDSNKFFVGTKIKVIVDDENYFKTTTPIYTITKNTQNKIVPLRTLNSLPNNNEVQLILENVFSANPLYGSAVTVDSIRSGEKSYLFFSLIINTDLNAVPIGVFYVGDKNKPTLDSNSAKIDGIYSVDYQTILSSNMSGLMIDPTNQANIVDEDAKIGNIIFNEIEGKYALPIILEIETDENTINDVINYQAFFGTDKNSLAYKFEFTVGKKFCTNNKTCPPFLYNNYIDKNGVTEEYKENMFLYLGNDYKIISSVENTSDRLFTNSELVLSIPKEGIDYALFSNDKNSVRFPLTLNPLSSSASKEISLELIKAKNIFSINQGVEKIVGGVDELRGVNNASEQKLKFSIKTKNQLEITTSPNKIDERTHQPFFVINTRIKGGSKVSANWKAEKLIPTGETELITSGVTDGNGRQIISFDAANLVKGDVVRFTAFDTNGSIEGYTDVNITSKFSTVETLPQECLSISVGETNVSTNDNYFVALDKGNSQIVTVDSNCSNERTISVVSDLELSEISIIVPANSQKSFTITATPRDSLLGAYPVQVVTVNGTRYSQLAYFDVVISDSSSCFELENAVFDFREINSINSKITNNCYEGRKDNFYPKMNISTNSVSLNYNKPGTPEDVNFTARVIGSALEVYVAGIGWATQWYQTNKGDSCRSVAQDNVVPTELYNMEDQTTECQALIDELSELKTISDLDWFTEPDLNETDPEKSYYNLPTEIQNKIISDLIAEEGSLSEIDTTTDTNSSTTTSNDDSDTNASFSSSRLNNKKTFKKLLFADATYTPENLPKSFTRGTSTEDLSFEFYPTPIGESMLEPQSSCEKVHNMDWVTAPYPENWGDCNVGECYTSIDERPIGPLEVVALSTCKPCKILSAELIEEEIRGVLYTKGETEDEALVGAGVGAVAGVAVGSFFGPWGAVIGGVVGAVGGAVAGMFIDDHETAKMTVQPEFYRNVYFVSEKKTEWEKEFTIKTTEGEVHDLGEYEATPTPSWTDLTEVKGHAVGQTWEEGSGDTNSVLLGALCGQGIGFIDVREGGEGYEVEEPSEIRVEYSSDGLIKYKIPDEAVPSDGIRVFLKNGHYYAEYIGSPEIDSEFIDFNLSKVNLVGNEYAII
ncbi:MAG TPA: glycine zipper domain-containing protein, partial [archaeon]|nr:glycine zipper domain-containing protein [archaeon]